MSVQQVAYGVDVRNARNEVKNTGAECKFRCISPAEDVSGGSDDGGKNEQQKKVSRTSAFFSSIICFSRKPASVAEKTISMDMKSPPNKRQNEALASEASSNTVCGLAGGVFDIFLNIARASSKLVFPSAMFQLSLLNWVLMSKWMPVWRMCSMLRNECRMFVVPYLYLYVGGQDNHFRSDSPCVRYPFDVFLCSDARCCTAQQQSGIF